MYAAARLRLLDLVCADGRSQGIAVGDGACLWNLFSAPAHLVCEARCGFFSAACGRAVSSVGASYAIWWLGHCRRDELRTLLAGGVLILYPCLIENLKYSACDFAVGRSCERCVYLKGLPGLWAFVVVTFSRGADVYSVDSIYSVV